MKKAFSSILLYLSGKIKASAIIRVKNFYEAMMKKISYYFIIISCLITTSCVFAGCGCCSSYIYKRAKYTYLFKFYKPGNRSSYLLGTWHNVKPKYLGNFMDQLVDIVDKADVVYFERDKPKKVDKKFIKKTAYRKPGEAGLYTLQNEELRGRIIEALTGGNLLALVNNGEELDRYNMRAIYYLYNRTFHTEDGGMDNWLAGRAIEKGKNIEGLESFEEQSCCPKDQQPTEEDMLILESMLRQPSNEEVEKVLAKRYLATDSLYYADPGYIQACQKLGLDESPKDLLFESQNITERNKKWMEKIIPAYSEYSKQNKSAFFVVGQAHLCDEEGLINLLLKGGFTVERMKSDGTWQLWCNWSLGLNFYDIPNDGSLAIYASE